MLIFAVIIRGASLQMLYQAKMWLPLTPSPSPEGEGNSFTNTKIAIRGSPLAVRFTLALK